MLDSIVRPTLAPALMVLLLLTAGCMPDLRHREILDLERMPQEPRAYLDPATAQDPLISAERQHREATAFLERRAAAWRAAAPLESTRNPFWALDWIAEKEVFAENLRPLEPERRKEMAIQADPELYPSLNRRAITVQRSDLRALPSHTPLFSDPLEAGAGFPFDNLQHAAIPANTPVHVTHRSRDGTWVLAETPTVYGWIPVTDLAWVDDEFVRAFEMGRYVALTHDDVEVFDAKGVYRFRAGIGTLLPVIDSGPAGYRVLLAIADRDRRALLTEATIPLDRGEIFPMPLTPSRLTDLAGRMMGQPYGWGDRLDGRDCSGTIRDLFAPFGLWLPRNSSRQAQVGTVIPLTDLKPHLREKRLLEEGVAFLTLVRTPGHIMLYIGEHEGRAALLHTFWGVRTRSFWGREGRWIVGRTVVTTLEPGAEQDSLAVGIGDLRSRVESMNILATSDSPHDAARRAAAD